MKVRTSMELKPSGIVRAVGFVAGLLTAALVLGFREHLPGTTGRALAAAFAFSLAAVSLVWLLRGRRG